MVKRYHSDSEYSYSLGIAPTLELVLQQPQQVIKVIASTKAASSEQVGRILHICRQQSIPVEFDDKQLSRLTNQENAYVAGVFNKYACELVAADNFVVLTQPSDAGNLGTIMRTMVAFGFANLAIIEPAVDPWEPKVIRASMGAIFQTNFHLFPTFADFRRAVAHPLYLFTGEGEHELRKLKLQRPYSLVFGNEGAGIPQEYWQLGETVSIKQTKKVDSLNLGIAVGVALYTLSENE